MVSSFIMVGVMKIMVSSLLLVLAWLPKSNGPINGIFPSNGVSVSCRVSFFVMNPPIMMVSPFLTRTTVSMEIEFEPKTLPEPPPGMGTPVEAGEVISGVTYMVTVVIRVNDHRIHR